MHAAGHKWPGHELLAHEFGVKTFSLVLSAGDCTYSMRPPTYRCARPSRT